jgi:hypothetical protein
MLVTLFFYWLHYVFYWLHSNHGITKNKRKWFIIIFIIFEAIIPNKQLCGERKSYLYFI